MNLNKFLKRTLLTLLILFIKILRGIRLVKPQRHIRDVALNVLNGVKKHGVAIEEVLLRGLKPVLFGETGRLSMFPAESE